MSYNQRPPREPSWVPPPVPTELQPRVNVPQPAVMVAPVKPEKSYPIKWLGVIGALLALIGSVLPWYSIKLLGKTYTQYGYQTGVCGPMVLIFSIITMILVIVPKVKPIFLGVVLGLDFFMLIVPIASLYINFLDIGGFLFVFVSVGVYLTIVGGVLTILGVGIYYFQLKKDVAAEMAIKSAPPILPPQLSWDLDSLAYPQSYQQPSQQIYPQYPQQGVQSYPQYPQQQYGYSGNQYQSPPQF